MKKYLTVGEFLKIAETPEAKKLTILCERDYNDGRGIRYRCDCPGPVVSLQWDEKEGELTFGDDTGDPVMYGLKIDSPLKRISHRNDGEWFYSIFWTESGPINRPKATKKVKEMQGAINEMLTKIGIDPATIGF